MLAGDLHDFALREVLRLLADGHKTGTVHVERDGADGRIAMAEGRVTAAVVSGEDAPDGAREVVDVVAHLLDWHDGTFRFERDEATDVPGSAGEHIAVDDLLARAATRAERLVALVEAQGSAETVVGLAQTDLDAEVAVSPAAWRLVVAIGGGRTIADLVSATTYSELELRELLGDMMSRGLVKPSVPGQVTPAGGEGAGDGTVPDPDAAIAGHGGTEPATLVAAADGEQGDALPVTPDDAQPDNARAGVDDSGDDAPSTADAVVEPDAGPDGGDSGVDAGVLARVVRGLEAR